MSQIVTTPIRKAAAGVKSAIDNPVNFILSLGIGFGLGVTADLLLEYLAWNHITQLSQRWKYSDAPAGWDPWQGSIPYDDLLLIVVNILLLFTRRFVLTLGFFLGWFCSTYYNLYAALSLPKNHEIIPPPS